jgi:2-oxoglutarate ferredoxin oxidoreductase subunit gamma
MNRTSVNKFNQKIKGGGMLMYNSSLIDRQEFRDDIRLVEIPATEIAAELGEQKAANMVMAGAYAKFSKLVTVEEIENSIRYLLKDENKEVIELNIESVKKGYDYVEEKKYMFGRYVHSVFRV